MSRPIVRSVLILPVNNRRFVDKACRRGADAVMLDLEDSVPTSEKENARGLVKEALYLAGRGGGQVHVRVNNEPEMLLADIRASIHPGLDCLVLPKVESAAAVVQVADQIEELEQERGLEPGRIGLSLVIETPKGFLNLQDIAEASPRTESMSIGPEDYCLELGVEPSPEGLEILYPLAMIVTVCKVLGLRPYGLLGSVAGFKDLEGYERAAARARQMGCEGAICIHPDQVAILNRVFSPEPQQVVRARRVVEAFEAGLERGTASVNVDGRMVDLPVYRRAKAVFDRALAIEELESGKAKALARLKEAQA